MTLCKFKIIPEEQVVFPQRHPSVPGWLTGDFRTQGGKENAFLGCLLESRYNTSSWKNSELNSFRVEISDSSKVGSSMVVFDRVQLETGSVGAALGTDSPGSNGP